MALSLRAQITSAAAAVLVVGIVLWRPNLLYDGDVWWQVGAGRLMIAQGAVLTTDPFSYTFAGQPWPTHEWLSEILFGAAYNLGEWPGVLTLTALAAGSAVWMLSRALARRLSGLPHLCLLLLTLLLFAPHLLARPHILVTPLLVAWVVELVEARDADRPPRWIFLALMLCWANMHGSFLFGLALIAPFALEALLAAPAERRLATALRWGGFGLASGVVSVISPHGISGVLFPLQHSSGWAVSRTDEWLPADFSAPTPLEIALLIGFFVLLTRPVRLSWLRALMLIGLIHASLSQIRHEQLLAVVGALLLAGPLARAYDQKAGEATPTTGRLRVAVAASALAAVLALSVGRLSAPVVWTDRISAPVSALAAVPASLRSQPVLNDFSFGAYLIGHGVRPFVDSRTELYGETFLRAYAELQDYGRPAQVAKVLAERKVQWTILVAGSPMAEAMDAQPGWQRLHTDRWAVVHVRSAAAP